MVGEFPVSGLPNPRVVRRVKKILMVRSLQDSQVNHLESGTAFHEFNALILLVGAA